jgi:hypothetical protein
MDRRIVGRSVYHAIRQFSNFFKRSSYQYGQLFFWLAVGVVGVAVLIVAAVAIGYSHPYLTWLVQAPNDGFFGSALNVILSIISLVFVIVVFLVQNATQEYSSRLSGVILRDWYFLSIIGFVLIGSAVSLSGSYFGLKPPFTLLGYAFSLATVLLVAALIAFTGFFINIANIIEYVTGQVERDISTNQIYKPNPLGLPLQDEAYISRLTSQTQLIVSTCIKAIEHNQQPVVDASLDALERIVKRFLAETTKADVDEDFLQEVNDQFQFIGSAALDEASRQKYADSVVTTIGDIGVAITESRELGTQGGLWANLLGDFFTESLQYDRTKAASFSIQKLGEMNIAAIKQGDFDSTRAYQAELEDISSICTAGNHNYLARLLQSLHGQYQEMYAAYLDNLLTDGHVAEYDLPQLLEEFADSFNEANSNYSHYNQQILYAGLFGVQPFAGKVAAPLLDHNPDVRTQQHLADYLEELIDFLHSISLTEVEANHPELYKGYTQFLFIFGQIDPFDEHIELDTVSELNEVWLDLVSETYIQAIENEDHVDSALNERLSDVTAMLIYFHKDDPEKLADLIEPLAEVYQELDEHYDDDHDYADKNLGRLYKQLKLAGAWVNQFHDPQATTPQLWDILVEEFYEIPESRGRIPRGLLPKYGYPTNTMFSRDQWWLYPDTLWSYTEFQDKIADALNGEDGSNYSEFHEQLKNHQ